MKVHKAIYYKRCSYKEPCNDCGEGEIKFYEGEMNSLKTLAEISLSIGKLKFTISVS